MGAGYRSKVALKRSWPRPQGTTKIPKNEPESHEMIVYYRHYARTHPSILKNPRNGPFGELSRNEETGTGLLRLREDSRGCRVLQSP